MICSECGQPLSPKEVHVHIGPGANESERLPAPMDTLLHAADGAK
jgi:hypothetical protein